MSASAPEPLRETPAGCLLAVHVLPRSQPVGLDGWHAGRLRVRLGAPPVDGAANKALVALLAKHFGLARGRVQLVSGETSRDKTILLAGLTLADATAALPAAE